jgi:hypothetical protein
MTTGDETIDEGGEAPCFAHLLDQPLASDDALLAEPPSASSTTWWSPTTGCSSKATSTSTTRSGTPVSSST